MSLGAYGLFANLALPGAAVWAALNPRTRRHLAERLAWSLPAVQPGALWLHAASLGEGRAASALAAGVAARWPDLAVLRTATSDTGRDQALPVDDVACLPLDAPWLQRRFVRRVRPRALVLVEGELWPGLILACRGRIPVVVAGLRVGQGTRRFARRFPGLWRSMAAAVSSWSARDADDALWLQQQLGVQAPVLGDLKLEAPTAPAALAFSRAMLLAGSTRPGDELALVQAWECLAVRPQLVLAPRHGDRVGEVGELLSARGLRWGLRSAIQGDSAPPELDVLVLDTVGELASLYPLAAAAFVGGTFDQAIGGHSAAEAAIAGVSVVHGPHTHANASSFEAASSFLAPETEQLAAALSAALAAPRPAPLRGRAVGRAMAQLEPLAAAPVAPEACHRPLLQPLTPAYRSVSWMRSRSVRRASPCPIISVGNIASGGTGKTPAVRHLLGLLEARGLRVAVVARGYRRAARGVWVRDSAGGPGTADWLGDELAMLSRQGALVVSSPDRLKGVRRAVELGAQLCILDDGFQQRDLQVDLDVVTVDARRPLAGGLLPAGEARELPQALARAGVLWVNHGTLPPELLRYAGDALQVRARMVPSGWLHRGENLALEAGPRGQVAALAGIARPGSFLRQLRRLGLVPARRAIYRDHAWWGKAELQVILQSAGGLPVVTTEKDLARLPLDFPCWALRVELEIHHGAAALDRLLDGFLADHGLVGQAP